MPRARARYDEERHYLPWFRWKRKKDTQAAPEGAQIEAPTAPVEPEAPEESSEEAGAPGIEADAQRAKRRRGSRGGRGRKKTTADGTADAAVSDGGGRDTGREKPERSQRAERAADRRRQAQQGA